MRHLSNREPLGEPFKAHMKTLFCEVQEAQAYAKFLYWVLFRREIPSTGRRMTYRVDG